MVTGQISNKRIIGLAGAGGTGKTVTLEVFSQKLNDIGIKHKIHPSIVRGFYKTKGITDEKTFHTSLDEVAKAQFQLELAHYFVKCIKEELFSYDGYLLCDRTIFDHLAYYLFSGINVIKLQEYREYLNLINDYLKNVLFLTYFPYPGAFSKDVDPDSFRWAPPAKNLIIDGLIYRHMFDAPQLFPRFKILGETIEERAEALLVDFVCYSGINQ